MEIIGKCHCGNLSFVLQTEHERQELPVRACSCSFCRIHAAKTSSDPNGSVRISVRNPANLSYYRFDSRTTDFLICKVCGVYLAAMISVNNQCRAVVNLQTTEFKDREALPVSYDGETKEARIERRLQKWTPVHSFSE